MTFSLSRANIRGILLDIEGATTPIAFVYEVLFPFARRHVHNFLVQNFDSAELQADLARLREEFNADLAQNLVPPPLIDAPREARIESIVSYVNWLMDRDRKSTGLKSLQGEIWEQGYREGTLKAQVFPDVVAALERWHRAGLKVGIFSSGSVLAQKLLFAHTDAGDLTKFLDGYFDTTTGPKTAEESYRRIASALGTPAAQILFVSDVTQELDGANAAGMQTLLCVRPGNHPQPPNLHAIIETFEEI